MSVAILDIAEVLSCDYIAVNADVADDASVQSAIADAIGQLGGLDILINCVGIGAQGGVSDNSDDAWLRIFNVNVVGMVRVIRSALPALRQSSAASIVNVSSAVATVGIPDRVLYSATKGAVLSMTFAMAADLLPSGIRVNAVNPGTTDTPWINRLLDNSVDPVAARVALENRQPHGRLVSATEVARAIAYLASPHSGSTTGTYLAVDGGLERLRSVSRK
jgi:2-keto-3-deoxy-L-fuconate dehydrogenase